MGPLTNNRKKNDINVTIISNILEHFLYFSDKNIKCCGWEQSITFSQMKLLKSLGPLSRYTKLTRDGDKTVFLMAFAQLKRIRRSF